MTIAPSDDVELNSDYWNADGSPIASDAGSGGSATTLAGLLSGLGTSALTSYNAFTTTGTQQKLTTQQQKLAAAAAAQANATKVTTTKYYVIGAVALLVLGLVIFFFRGRGK